MLITCQGGILSADSEKEEHLLRTETSNEWRDRNREMQSPESEPETKDNGVRPRPRRRALCSSLAVRLPLPRG